jgi:hypothetical protein
VVPTGFQPQLIEIKKNAHSIRGTYI